MLEWKDCSPPKCRELSEYTDSAHTEVEDLSSRCMNGLNEYVQCSTTQDNFILPDLPVGRLPISLDRLDRMKLVRNCTIPIILPSGKNILVNMVFKISISYTNLHTKQIQSRLHSRICLFITSNVNMAGYSTKHVFIGKLSYQEMLQLYIL